MDSVESSVPSQSVFDQKVRKAAATSTLCQGLLLEAAHHTACQRQVEAFRVSGLGDLGRREIGWLDLKLLLELFQQFV